LNYQLVTRKLLFTQMLMATGKIIGELFIFVTKREIVQQQSLFFLHNFMKIKIYKHYFSKKSQKTNVKNITDRR
jgi:hypothetical protein